MVDCRRAAGRCGGGGRLLQVREATASAASRDDFGAGRRDRAVASARRRSRSCRSAAARRERSCGPHARSGAVGSSSRRRLACDERSHSKLHGHHLEHRGGRCTGKAVDRSAPALSLPRNGKRRKVLHRSTKLQPLHVIGRCGGVDRCGARGAALCDAQTADPGSRRRAGNFGSAVRSGSRAGPGIAPPHADPRPTHPDQGQRRGHRLRILRRPPRKSIGGAEIAAPDGSAQRANHQDEAS